MTEEHKQKIRDAHARRAAERRSVNPPVTQPPVTVASIDTPASALPEPVITGAAILDEMIEKSNGITVPPTPFPSPNPLFIGADPAVPGADVSVPNTRPGDHTDHLTPHQSFCVWLKSKPGIDASDPRLPSDYARQCVEIEDRLRTAFNAGFVAGKGGTP